MGNYKSWVEIGGGSDHNPIYLKFVKDKEKPSTLFKFNWIWLEDEGFVELVKSESVGLNSEKGTR
jgi:hypothetical protein